MFSMSIQVSQYACKHRSVKTILNKATKSMKKQSLTNRPKKAFQ